MTLRRPQQEDATQLARLPPGRHGLPPEFVAENQRARLIAGIVSAVAKDGYNEATITQIASAAGVSRRTFYVYFSSKQEGFFAVYDLIAAHIREATSAAAAEHRDWPDRVRAKIGALLEVFVANPDLVSFYLVASSHGGGEIAARYRLTIDRALAELTDGMPPPPATREVSVAAEQSMLGGIAALIVRKVNSGQGERLLELLPDLLELALTPYLGRAEASRLARASH